MTIHWPDLEFPPINLWNVWKMTRYEKQQTRRESSQSPCTNECSLNIRLGICMGCGRTSGEIGQWARLTEAEKNGVRQKASVRLRELYNNTKNQR